MASDPAIISCAITGSVHTPSLSPALPVTPEEIAKAAIDAAEAGAAIVHLHARDPEDGRPSGDPEVYAQFLPKIKQGCNAVINITTGGSSAMTLDERLAAARRFRPELCSCNLGSMNFGFWKLADAHGRENFKHDWEVPFIERTKDLIFRNTFGDIEAIVGELGPDGTRFEFEAYDVGHLYTLANAQADGLIEPPFFIQFVLGVLGGISARAEHLVHLVQTADRLFGDDYRFSVMAAGRSQMRIGTLSGVLGGSVRVGLEDSLYIAPGKLAQSNAEQVAKIRRILEELGIEIATPDQAREMLALKGESGVRI